jgi:starch phosphorylase
MVREYVRNLYVPAARSSARTIADGFRGAKALAEYRDRLRAHWAHVRVADLELDETGHTTPLLGTPVRVRALLEHGELQPDELDVQVVFGRVDDAGDLYDLVTVPMRHETDGRYEAELPLPRAGAVGYTVRVLPKHDLLATPAELGRIVLAH